MTDSVGQSAAFPLRAMANQVPATPTSEDDFTAEWLHSVLSGYFAQEGMDSDEVEVTSFRAARNAVQGILSVTYVVDVEYTGGGGGGGGGDGDDDDDDDAKTTSVFVKVPLSGDEPLHRTVNEREALLLGDVLPRLQSFIEAKCQGFFRLPMPRLLHAHYDGRGIQDVFVLENLLSADYYNFSTGQCLDEDHMMSVLDCLSYLHGTGLAYKMLEAGGSLKRMQADFSRLEVQIQLSDLLESDGMRAHFRRHFRAFLHYLEEAEPGLARHTTYMQRMHRNILQIVALLEGCGYEKLITLAHGDAKPNNFMFRKIEIDLEELSCEGIESILIDWQGGFLGSVANDLMWALYPFFERDPGRQPRAVAYYHEQLGNVLQSFGLGFADLDLPATYVEFSTLLKRSLVLEFLTVTVIKPIVALEKPEKLHKWHKETLKNRKRRFKKKVEKPELLEVFNSPRFPAFCHLYFKIATALSAFNELGSMHFELTKESMFEKEEFTEEADSDEDEDADLVSRILNAPARTLAMASAGIVLPVGVLLGSYLSWRSGWLDNYIR